MSQVTCPNCGVVNRQEARFCTKCGYRLTSPGILPGGIRTLKRGQMLRQRYRIECELGRGGFGAVYQAWDNNLNRWCAVKENRDSSSEAQRQFLREATVLANISHPNLPRVVDHFFIPNQGQYLVMDFVEGEDLDQLAARQGFLPQGRCLTWILQVAEALEYLHALDPPVIHRDIKPANIRITSKGQAVLVDFGLVKFSNLAGATTVGAQAVTPGYAPPEQYGMGTTDVRTDVYALSATLYRLLSGREPPESIHRLSGSALPEVAQMNPAVSPALSRIIDKGMAVDPRLRYQTVTDLKIALLGSLPQPPVVPAGPPPVAVPIPRTVKMEPGMLPQALPVSEVAPPRRAASPRSVPQQLWLMVVGLLAAGLLVIAVLGFIIWIILSNQAGGQAQLTTTSQFQSSATELSRFASSTAQLQASQTAAVQSATALAAASITARAGEIATARSQATERAQATDAFFSSLLSQRRLVSGPKSGSLDHNPADNEIVVDWIEVDLRDMVVEARFLNPYDAAAGPWAHGLVLTTFNENQYRIVIDSQQRWDFTQMYRGDQKIDEQIARGSFSAMRVGENDANDLRLIWDGGQGWLFINGQLVDDLDLSSWSRLRWIGIATGLWIDSEIRGKTTPYQDFTIWSLR